MWVEACRIEEKKELKTGSRGFDKKERKRWNQKVRRRTNSNKMHGKEVEIIYVVMERRGEGGKRQ